MDGAQLAAHADLDPAVRDRLSGGRGRPSGFALRSPHREPHVDKAEVGS